MAYKDNAMRAYRVNLNLNVDQMERFYGGGVRNVWARDVNGLRLQFPVASLRPFVSHAGVRGHFELLVDKDARLQSIRRISENYLLP